MGGNYTIGQKSPSQQTYRTGGTHTTQQVGNAIYEQAAIRCLQPCQDQEWVPKKCHLEWEMWWWSVGPGNAGRIPWNPHDWLKYGHIMSYFWMNQNHQALHPQIPSHLSEKKLLFPQHSALLSLKHLRSGLLLYVINDYVCSTCLRSRMFYSTSILYIYIYMSMTLTYVGTSIQTDQISIDILYLKCMIKGTELPLQLSSSHPTVHLSQHN